MNPMLVILGREIRSYARQRRTMIFLVLLSAALANGGYALVSISPLVRFAFVTHRAAAVTLSGHHDLAQSALVWIGLLPVLFSAQQAAITLAAERERRSLTALLAAPISIGSILVGKLLGSMAPGLLMLAVANAVYLSRVVRSAPGAGSWLPLGLVAAVLFLLLALSTLMNALALLVSALAPTVAGASITATFVLLPITLGLAVLSIKVSEYGPLPFALIGLALAAVTVGLVWAMIRLLGRAHLLAV